MSVLRSSLLFWFSFGWLAFPFFINVPQLQRGNFATARVRSIGYVYLLFLIVLLFTTDSLAWLFWISLTGVVFIYVSMGAFIYYFDDEEYIKEPEEKYQENRVGKMVL